MTLIDHKRTLKAKGWSYRRVAPVLGVNYVHLALVLTGKRQSKRLLAAISALPDCAAPSAHRPLTTDL